MNTPRFAQGPLQGVRVIDLTSVVLGPYATHILGDLGADVIKVESLAGDSTRDYQPLRHAGMSGFFLNLNRNKRSIALDLKRPEGLQALKQLIAGAQVFVHNMRGSAIEQLGLGYEAVKAVNPDIVYCAAYGFGAGGPYSDKAAYDDVIQAGSGLASLYAAAHGAPAFMPTVLCDKVTGQAVAYAILAALYQQARGGGGQAVEVPMLETTVEFALVEHLAASAFQPPLAKAGFPRVLSPHRKPYRTADGYICLLPYSDRNWQDFFAFTGRQEFASDPRFARLADRVQNIDVLYALLAEEASRFSTAEWVKFCDEVSIPCMPVLGLDELADDPHLKAVRMFSTVEHPSEGDYRSVRSAVSFSGSAFTVRHHAPRHGQHSAEVLAEAGYAPGDIGRLAAAGIVKLAPLSTPTPPATSQTRSEI